MRAIEYRFVLKLGFLVRTSSASRILGDVLVVDLFLGPESKELEMIFPVRCFTCFKLIGHRWKEYQDLLKEYDEGDALDIMDMRRYCCRRMFLTHVEIIDDLLRYKSVSCLSHEHQEKEALKSKAPDPTFVTIQQQQ